ncbi:MAG: transcriptional coactivator p15/PC4 family protein [Candidatus Marinimicrobia bacterium]|nr:transcriptional coactivator p15/PC4 family protein [Candidatus Neomarinimicrobiota bacterium]
MEKIIGEVERSETEKIIIQVKEFKGRTYVDFRIHYLADEDEWRPTQKGITVAPALWEGFKKHVDETDKFLETEGMI